MFVIKTILKDSEVAFDSVSLIDRVLISFNSKEKLKTFLNSKDSIHDYFSEVKQWDDNFLVAKRFLWINVFGIPPHLWFVDFFLKLVVRSVVISLPYLKASFQEAD